ncbi:MAG: bifunctional folylpolyglutamate synthase/dihydrofolate synthase, partial [Eggerthellaceae bacterium]|nr:bifunctional folylpolyglutamate synthase/dihydrofolate synthase [Eggerthellaceae bacterium]
MEAFDPVAYINEPRWRSSRPGLERIAELMGRLGNPQDSLRFVHVAGTNGKGSTCAFLASILQRAGYKTGLFTSPYIIEFSDRIRVNGENISPEDLLAVTLDVREEAEAMDDHPTEFELMTAVALLHFARVGCDICVLEVGLGGSMDSTNIIPAPEVCVIVPIDYDHTDLLGNTLTQIASEKAGIVKPGSVVVSAVQQPEAAAVLEAACERNGCALSYVDLDVLSGTPLCFSYGELSDLRIGLLGSYQTQNAALAIEAACALRERGFAIGDDALREGLADTYWPGRFEVVAHYPTFIVDGGHNPQGAKALVDSLELNFPCRRVVFMMGVLRDKDYTFMVDTIAPLAEAFVCITPPSPRALSAEDLAHVIDASAACPSDASIEAATSIAEGVVRARQLAGPDGIVCACGSLYSIADIVSAILRTA